MRRRLTGVVAAALGVAVAAPALITLNAPAAEAVAYRYWTYWHVTPNSATWDFARVGPAAFRPKDGHVEAWRFAVSPGTASAPAPRHAASTAFDEICDGTPAQDGRKRVAVLVDFGVAGDAPSGDAPPSSSVHGTCVSLPTTGTGMDAMAAAGHSLRIEDGMVCGVSGYPRKGCGDVVKDVPADPAPSASSGNASGSGSAKSNSGSTRGGNNGGGKSSKSSNGANATTGATASASASASASGSGSASPSAAASQGGIPSAAPVASGSALPTLVEGAPAADTSGSSDTPWPALLGIGLVLAVAGAGALQVRRRREA